jgi:hypothetical protein
LANSISKEIGQTKGACLQFGSRLFAFHTEFFALLACIFSFMHLHMRTTIDVPDDLLRRVRPLLAERKMTFRALVIDAVERAIEVPAASFRLRDASAGRAIDGTAVSSEAINRAIHEAREPSFQV